MALALWFTLRLAEPISRVLGKTGINLVTHLMGLVLAAVAGGSRIRSRLQLAQRGLFFLGDRVVAIYLDSQARRQTDSVA